jgi:hypothetical protein
MEIIQMNERRNNFIGGLILVLIGLVTLANQFVEIELLGNLALYFMAGLGAIFLLWGVLTREAGLIIPGGIISGIGWGIVLTAGSAGATHDEGGLFMLAFAAGWAAITVLTAVFTAETHWWPLIPGGVMAFIGLAVLQQGIFMTALEWLGRGWPLILIVVGVTVLLKGYQHNQEKLQ